MSSRFGPHTNKEKCNKHKLNVSQQNLQSPHTDSSSVDISKPKCQGRRLRFASGRDNYGERSEPKKFIARRGIIHPETADRLRPLRCQVELMHSLVNEHQLKHATGTSMACYLEHETQRKFMGAMKAFINVSLNY
jgi:hypothetical protein